MSTSTPKKTEWRKKPVDRSKRVAYGCKIESKNIITGTRRRKDFNYKITADNYQEFQDYSDEDIPLTENYIYPILERKPRKSNNSIDKRIERFDPNNPESVKQLKQTLKNKRKSDKENEDKEYGKRGRRKNVKKNEKNEEKKNEVKEEEKMDDSTSEEVKESEKEKDVISTENVKVEKQETKKATKKPRKQNKKSESNKPEKENGLPESCVSKLKELGATLKSRGARKYKDIIIPVSIQAFLDHKFPDKLVLNNEVVGVTNLSFSGEYLLTKEEMDEFKFLRENSDAILIGEGEFISVAKLGDKNGDFDIYFLDDEKPDAVKGPFKVSGFLADCTVGEAPEDDMEE